MVGGDGVATATRTKAGLDGPAKAAAVVVALGPDASAAVFKHLSDEEIEQLTLEVANMPRVARESSSQVLTELFEMTVAHEYVAEGGVEYARSVLEKAVGADRALEILERLTSTFQVRPFEVVRRADPDQVFSYIQNEHPQTIALVMAFMNPPDASQVLSLLPPEQQVDVSRRLAMMDRASPDVIRQVEQVLERRLSTLAGTEYSDAGGVESLVAVLNQVDRGTEKTILEAMEIQDQELAEEIRRRMFVFDDIVYLDDRSLQRVLRDVDLSNDLPLALKGVGEDVLQKVERNVSSRAAETLREDIQYLGPVRLRQVDEAQQKIVNVIRRLEEDGEIVVARGSDDDVII